MINFTINLEVMSSKRNEILGRWYEIQRRDTVLLKTKVLKRVARLNK